jgi:hypothetical protein
MNLPVEWIGSSEMEDATVAAADGRQLIRINLDIGMLPPGNAS